MIVVNFKTYAEGTGFKARELAEIMVRVANEEKIRIVAVPQLVDVKECVEIGVECWVQHVDAAEQGKFTGWVTQEAVEEAGAVGALLNHSEHKLKFEDVKKIVEEIGESAFQICVCVEDIEEAKRVAGLTPQVDYIAYEPAELIGSREKSVASEKPEIISQVVKAVNVPVLIGAGVHSEEDVRVGLRLGAKGILLATDVVLAKDPETELRKLARAFK